MSVLVCAETRDRIGKERVAVLGIRWFSMRRMWPASKSSAGDDGVEFARITPSEHLFVCDMVVVSDLEDSA